MNKQDRDVMKELFSTEYINQRILAENSGYSLGTVNKSIKNLMEKEFITEDLSLTNKALSEIKSKKPRNAIILAAGYGMRMIPINMEYPKGLLEVNGETLIERLINQLNDVGISEINIVVGFMKEQYEYLIDKYGVQLIVNPLYASKNNLYSLSLVADKLSNTYIIPCDIWCRKNPFNRSELYSWYMVSDNQNNESEVRVNRKSELIKVPDNSGGNSMIGISYLIEEQASVLRERLTAFSKDRKYDSSFWESALYEGKKMLVYARLANSADFVEINTYEQLRELDGYSNQLKSKSIEVISRALNVSTKDITDITVLKKGMTNRSFLFSCNGKKYIMRIPGEGTDQLINREQEASVYDVIKDREICDDVYYIEPQNGYKITAFLEGARECNPYNVDDLNVCMKKLRDFHSLKLIVQHEFDIFSQIEFYESLWNGKTSVYRDYDTTKKNIFTLKQYIDENRTEKVLTHIDSVPDNFLFIKKDDGTEYVRLIDWEYSGMQDPHVDIAMFCIYSLYDRAHVDQLIDIYFEGNCPDNIRVKIYCYIAACGLLWSNWCEYKSSLGIEFGEYSLRQYRYAKDYYNIVKKQIYLNGEKE